jgi:hypothetical protein
MSEAILLLALYALMTWTVTTLSLSRMAFNKMQGYFNALRSRGRKKANRRRKKERV